MSSKVKRNVPLSVHRTPANSIQEKPVGYTPHFSTIMVLLYLVAELVPQGGATDVMAPQWLYIALLDLCCSGYFMIRPKAGFDLAINRISGSTLTLLYASFYILSGISIGVAINKIESLVCFARFTASMLMFFNLAVML